MMLCLYTFLYNSCNVYMQYTFTNTSEYIRISYVFINHICHANLPISGRTRHANRHQNGGNGGPPDRGPTSRSHGRQKVGGNRIKPLRGWTHTWWNTKWWCFRVWEFYIQNTQPIQFGFFESNLCKMIGGWWWCHVAVDFRIIWNVCPACLNYCDFQTSIVLFKWRKNNHSLFIFTFPDKISIGFLPRILGKIHVSGNIWSLANMWVIKQKGLEDPVNLVGKP